MQSVTQDDVARQFNTHSEDYDATTNKSIGFSGLKVDFFVRAKAEHILAEARKHYDDISNISVLDIGCGVGKYHPLLTSHVGHITGIEVSEDSIKIAKEKSSELNVDYLTYKGDRLPFEDNHFDLCYTICVMHHVPPPLWERFSSEMMRVTKPGGLALIFEHNPLNPLTRKAVNDCPYDKDAVLLRTSKIKELFSATKPQKMNTEHILTIPATTGLLKIIDKMFGRFPFGAQYCQRVIKAKHPL